MNGQTVDEIPVEKLILWTENPRDAISPRNNNKAIIKQALEDPRGRWEIKKFSRMMGPRYDLSELPTVVYKKGRPIVYDGNRRVILAMLKLGIYKEFGDLKFRMPECPRMLPCCVAHEKIALENVWRKHADTGSWDQISRDLFLYKFMNMPKSVLLQLDCMLDGRIEATDYLNQRFVRDEVLVNPRLKKIGIKIENGKVFSRHNAKDTKVLLGYVFSLVQQKKVSTRIGRRTSFYDLFDSKLKLIVDADANKNYHTVVLSPRDFRGLEASQKSRSGSVRLPRRVQSVQMPLFGGKIDLRTGGPANLYRDILELYGYYESNKDVLSDRFPALIRMALRLECELIAKYSPSCDMATMIRTDFDSVKSALSKDQKTFLAQNAVSKDNIVGLIQAGAHDYTGSYDLSQTIAMSLIVGGLLRLHCARSRS